MVLVNDPRKTKDVVGASSSQDRLLEDILAEGIALSLASGTASNYLSDKYGSNHKIIFESVAKIISRIVIDSLDLIDDYNYQNLRVEYISNKLLFLIFEDGKIPSYDDTSELKSFLIETIKSILKGTTKESITTLLNNTSQASKLNLEEVSDYVVSIFTSVYGSTSISQNHRHFVFSKNTGLGSTGSPIGYTWGDDLHTHDIIDGVVQPHTDGHTHILDFGISQETLKLQENIKKFFDVTKPAHIKIGENTTILDETVTAPILELNLSLGSSYQEDMRVARNGVYDSVLLAYTNGTRTIRVYDNNLVKPNILYSKVNADSTDIQKHRIISDPVLVTPTDGEYTVSFPRILNNSGNVLSLGGTYTVLDGRLYVEEFVTERLGDGELVLLNGVCYFLEIKRTGLDFPYFYPKAYEINLDNIVQWDEGIIEVKNGDSPYRVEDIRYREFTYTADNNTIKYTPSNFPVSQEKYKNAPIIDSDFDVFVNGTNITDLIPQDHVIVKHYYRFNTQLNNRALFFSFYDTVNNQFVDVGNVGDEIKIKYPYSVDHSLLFSSLNDPMFTLNSFRTVRQVETISGRDSDKGNSKYTPKHPYVLYAPKKITSFKTYRREIFSSILKQNVLNTTSTLGQLTLNNHQVDTSINIKDVYGIAVGNGYVKDNKLDISQLGFYPSKIISMTDNLGNSYSGKIKGVYIEITQNIDNDVLLEVNALSKKPFGDDEDWFRFEVRNEGQVPFVSSSSVPYPTVPTVDEVMANPQGRPLPSNNNTDEDRTVSGRVTERTEGQKGELYLYRDSLTRIEISGKPFNETNSTLNSEMKLNQGYQEIYSTNTFSYRQGYTPYTSQFILGGTVNGITYDGSKLDSLSILAQDNNKAEKQVSIIMI